ncbi:hypothetical protein BGZ52_003703 [Haplosporangium bisporale]|nr:hypothetical protein BGZ52_003703 [Haplosporangium bisporale]
MSEKLLLSIEQVDEALSSGNTDFLLCHLSSQHLLQHKETLGALLVRTDILNRLADVDSLHAQYVIFRLLKAVLLLDTHRRNANINHKGAFLQTLFTKLISPACSAMVKRAILELYHGLLKDHRQLLEDAEVESDLDHPAASVLEHLSTLDLWSLAPNLLKEPLQHATLVLLIDIEKARTRLDTTVSGMTRSVHLCHDAILGCLPQAWTTTTNFIRSECIWDDTPSCVTSILSSTGNICQLGKVLMSSIVAIQDIVIDELSSSPSSFVETYEQLIEAIPALDTFLHEWVGPQTLQLVFQICGEDDTNVAWFLKTSVEIQQRLEAWMAFEQQRCTVARVQATTTTSTLLSLENFVRRIHVHLHRHVHPVEALFTFLESIGYDSQTLLDLLLTLDDHTGGMLGALMAILRKLTEDPVDWQRLTTRWQETLERGNVEEDDDDDDDDDDKEEEGYSLPYIEACLNQLATQIRALDQKSLFPYNPKPLLLVLHRTQELLAELNAYE